MPKTTSIAEGYPCWADLATTDLEGSIRFYEQLFGWEADRLGPDFGDYVIFRKNGAMISGAMPISEDTPMPVAWSIYLKTSDVDGAAAAVPERGGQVLVPPMDIPDKGRMAFIADASGAPIGLWQAAGHEGYELYGEHGAPAWHELHTLDYAAALDFYRQLLGWEIQIMGDTDEFRYSVSPPENSQVGVMDGATYLPEGVPSHWAWYIAVDDVDAAEAQAVSLGASVAQPAMDTPYGRMSFLVDPHGAPIRIITGTTSPE